MAEEVLPLDLYLPHSIKITQKGSIAIGYGNGLIIARKANEEKTGENNAGVVKRDFTDI